MFLLNVSEVRHYIVILMVMGLNKAHYGCVYLQSKLWVTKRPCRVVFSSRADRSDSVRSLNPELCPSERTAGQMQVIEMKWIYSKSAFLPLLL